MYGRVVQRTLASSTAGQRLIGNSVPKEDPVVDHGGMLQAVLNSPDRARNYISNARYANPVASSQDVVTFLQDVRFQKK